eukprot:TRINITY_DN130_c0_g2_i1.p2 TRINITY_DN130_c0_g2~~TRINITY_DN130_c0_g2_i1.p2  ORF type:complete len:228 (+),score=-19.02 TRINITY_DN130_c0_g2_i1:270-953(+)
MDSHNRQTKRLFSKFSNCNVIKNLKYSRRQLKKQNWKSESQSHLNLVISLKLNSETTFYPRRVSSKLKGFFRPHRGYKAIFLFSHNKRRHSVSSIYHKLRMQRVSVYSVKKRAKTIVIFFNRGQVCMAIFVMMKTKDLVCSITLTYINDNKTLRGVSCYLCKDYGQALLENAKVPLLLQRLKSICQLCRIKFCFPFQSFCNSCRSLVQLDSKLSPILNKLENNYLPI